MPSPMPQSAPRRRVRCAKSEARLSRGRSLGRVFTGVSLGSHPAAGRARPRDHLRLDGRDQHGARRADHDRRLRDLRGAEPVPQHLAGRSTGTCAPRCRCRFFAAALVGMALERSVIRFLYGRPLETLLATWGISLILIQTVRTLFGAQNVRSRIRRGCRAASQSRATSCCPTTASSSSSSPRSCCSLVWLLLDAHPPRPVRARRDTEPRDGGLRRRAAPRASIRSPSASARASPASPAARCRRSATSAPTSARPTSSTRSWWWCWAASASSPGRCMRRSAWAWRTSSSKRWSGAVLAKIAVLVFIIIFIQKRPQGLFALKGRAADA